MKKKKNSHEETHLVRKDTKLLGERKRLVYFIITLITLVASLIAIMESRWVKTLFLKPPEVSHLWGKQSRPHVIWGKVENKDAITGIGHVIPIRLTNNNDISLKIEAIEIDWGEFNLRNEMIEGKPIGIKGSSALALEHGNLFGDCGLFAERYETQGDMLEFKRKDFADFPFIIRPYEEMLLTLEFHLFFEKDPPHKVFVVKGAKDEFEAMFNRLMPMFFGFDSPSRKDYRLPGRSGTIIFHTNHRVFRVRTWFCLPFVGTIVYGDPEGKRLGVVFE